MTFVLEPFWIQTHNRPIFYLSSRVKNTNTKSNKKSKPIVSYEVFCCMDLAADHPTPHICAWKTHIHTKLNQNTSKPSYYT